MRFIYKVLVLTGLSTAASAQSQFLYLDQRPPVLINSDTLAFPWTGGFNSIIPVEIDLNGDNLKDIFFFDRVGNRISTFLNNGSNGQGAYRYHPEYISQLPALHDWVRSADFDCDGDLDLFTYSNSAMGIWRNDFTAGSGLQFTLFRDTLYSWYGTFYNPIFVSQVNMPAIVDVDGDSDLDIITFANSSNYLEYHKNYAMDSLGICGDFLFTLEPYCWGYFKLSGLTNIGLLNQNCRSGFSPVVEPEGNKSRHSGSVLTPLDQDCDGDVDLLNGDILGENMLFLLNGGTPDSAVITAQDSAFPVYDISVNMQNLPAAYYLDLDNDGFRDMLVSPFATVGEDFFNLHWYKNTGDNCSNVFDFIKNRFIADETMDVGTAANVAFFDVDKDGLTDIVAGNDQYYNANPNLAFSRLAWFKNTGTVTQPAFSLISDDWLGLSGITQYGLYPSFGDLDGDNDDDLLLGNADGTLIYYQNTAAPGAACNFVFASPQFQGIDIGNNSIPQIIDVNRDGKNDLLVGERTGTLNYFENTGSAASPVYTLVSSAFGGVNVLMSGAIAGYSAPQLFDINGNYELLVGSDQGRIYHYNNIDGNLGGSFTLLDSAFQGIIEPKRVTISKSDIDGDGKYDLLTGCNAGGMRLYTQFTSASLPAQASGFGFTLSPNPADASCNIQVKDSRPGQQFIVDLCDITGKKVIPPVSFTGQMQLNTAALSPGIYLVSIRNEAQVYVKKLIIN
ncbi:MAG: T9SS type A sorting domain-containing protein [Bacteroidia bacterium]|nr:T9SS type A sorting domain-containing protein [Bacteroidia bacterium]